MTCFRKTLISCVFSGGLVAAPTAWGQGGPLTSGFLDETEVALEADFDLLVGIGESHAPDDGPYADSVLRGATETLTDQGWRFEIVDMDGRKIDKLLVSKVEG